MAILSRKSVFLLVLALTACASGGPEKTKLVARNSKSDAVPPADVVIPEGQIWVAKSDGSQSCGAESGMSLAQAAAELKRAGVKILKQKAGNDGKVHMMVCGAATGNTVEALIDSTQYPLAEKLGYRLKGK